MEENLSKGGMLEYKGFTISFDEAQEKFAASIDEMLESEERMMMEYRGFTGTKKYDALCQCWHGHVNENECRFDYAGKTLEELEFQFHAAVDIYLKEERW